MKSSKSQLSRSSFPIVGIGASAGGLAAFIELLSGIPPDSGMAFVIVQHLDPTQTSMLGEVLARATAMKVATAANGTEVEPNHVYVIPPNTDIAVEGNSLLLVPREEARKPHLSIDFFLPSLAEERGAQAIGVVLSGSGSDGTEGLRAIKAEGGITFAQAPPTAEFGAMPQSAIKAGVVDAGMPIAALARELVRLGRHPYLAAAAPSAPSEKDEGSFSYQDKGLGDTEPVAVATAPDVFRPTSTTVLLLRAARKALAKQRPHSVLDLGCGAGIVAVVLAKLLPADTVVCASDLSPAAVALARRNAERNGIAVQCLSGSLFDPWRGQRFNLIVDDVAGVAEPLDRLSGWYPPGVPSAAGSDGTRWVLEILDQAPDFLAQGGLLIFPVLTLSREQPVTERARSRFAAVELVEEQWYPVNEQLLEHLPLLQQMATAGNVRVEKRGSRWCWATRIYLAHRH